MSKNVFFLTNREKNCVRHFYIKQFYMLQFFFFCCRYSGVGLFVVAIIEKCFWKLLCHVQPWQVFCYKIIFSFFPCIVILFDFYNIILLRFFPNKSNKTRNERNIKKMDNPFYCGYNFFLLFPFTFNSQHISLYWRHCQITNPQFLRT